VEKQGKKRAIFAPFCVKKSVFSLFFKVFDVENSLRTSYETLKSSFSVGFAMYSINWTDQKNIFSENGFSA